MAVAVVLGTRPEIVKLARVIHLLDGRAWVIHTGQHYAATLSDRMMTDLRLPPPDVHLDVGGQHRGVQIGRAVERLTSLFLEDRPEAVIVQGDTNAALAGGLAANAVETALVHGEAGLRSRDRAIPEEHNRVVLDHLADLCLAPTLVSAQNLVSEGVSARIEVTGNTVVEAVHAVMPPPRLRAQLLQRYGLEAGRYLLATFHRPENTDEPDNLKTVLSALGALPMPVVLPMHPRTSGQIDALGLWGLLDGLHVTEPLPYSVFLALSAESAFLVSDSGGVQEEASIHKRPVIVVRRSTERPEVLGLFAECVQPELVSETALDWIDNLPDLHDRLRTIPSPYGDGEASALGVRALDKLLADGR